MDLLLHPRLLHGQLAAIPSKSQAHRLLICAALADGPTQLICPQTSRDMDATADCLNALGASITRNQTGYHILPIHTLPENADLPCQESGSTLRFLLPLAGALGVQARFRMEGRLPQRPLSPLWEEMERMGCQLSRPKPDTILCQGQLRPGTYRIPGSISSQYITGLLFALPLLDGGSHLEVTGVLESRPYVDLTRQALALFGIHAAVGPISGRQMPHTPGTVAVEGDWSNAAFFLAAQALGSQVQVTGLSPHSLQGDRAVAELLPKLRSPCSISARDIPDLVPILAVFAAFQQGAVFTDIQRLRMKESDRVASTTALIRSLGGQAHSTSDTLTIGGGGLRGGCVDAMNDHRIAMAAAIAATCCREPVAILGAQCVQKSYPGFWEEYARLGGHYEQYLR